MPVSVNFVNKQIAWLWNRHFTKINHNIKQLICKTMSKRAATTMETNSIKKRKDWSLGLVESMKDPKLVVRSTETLVVIKDKYPKAKTHYLVLPQENISSIFKLDKSHINLIEQFGDVYKDIQSEEGWELKAGFHLIPSMQRLHMHIISKDMISNCLKTKVHWNSFTTKFFLPYEDLLKQLKENGCIKKISNELHKSLLSTELQCNQCSYKPKNMPQLKQHLLSHNK